MDFKSLHPMLKFLYMAMTKSAIMVKEMGNDKEFFVNLAKEIWDSMEMSDFDALKNTIDVKMRQDLEPYVEEYIKSRNGNGMD